MSATHKVTAKTVVRFRHGAWLADCRDPGCWWHASIRPVPGWLSGTRAWALVIIAATAHASRGIHQPADLPRGWDR